MATVRAITRNAKAPRRPKPSRVTTVRLTVEYDGTAFCGFQWQPAERTVAGVLETALSTIFEETVKVSAAGRTDSGAHASGQVISFQTAAAFPFDRLVPALTSLLPRDLSVRDGVLVPDGFSARHSAFERTYVYAIRNAPEPSALLARYAHFVWVPLDLDRFGDGAAQLIGEHDFRSFCGVLPEQGTTVRQLSALTVERRDELVRVSLSASGFLHRMARTIVGTLIECAAGRRDPASLGAVLAARYRAAAGSSAPAHGLYLAGVRYPDYDSFREPPLFAA
jgi:tRNA pseudouridine38-40 synthase